MARRMQFAPGEFYHIYLRGVDKRQVFLDMEDSARFVKLLFLCNSAERVNIRDIGAIPVFEVDRSETLTDIGAYCLMKNHYHLLIHEKEERGISKFMQKLGTAYTMYFNGKYDRKGSLFESRFNAKHLDSGNYLRYIFAYIHLNPVDILEPGWKKKGIKNIKKAKKFLEEYDLSSYIDYLGQTRPMASILNKEAFPDYFKDNLEFDEYLEDWLNYKGSTFGEKGLFG